jgi:hypothetical protein
MSAPPILCHIYREHIEHFGEPAESIVFDDPPPPDDTWPDRITVMIWPADDECNVTTFATIGMAIRPMQKVAHRAELHFGIRATLSPSECRKVAFFMANLALYPFLNQTSFDWWHKVRKPGAIPEFPSCSGLFFHPRFVEDGWDKMDFEGIPVKILSIIPVTQEEYELGSPTLILELMAEREVDFLAPR